MLKVLITFVFCITITIAEDSSENGCDYLKGKSNIGYFDVEKYSGKWFVSNYVINSWRTVHNNKVFVQCQSLIYQLNSDKSGYHIQAHNSLVPYTTEYHSYYYKNWINFTTKFDSEKSPLMEMSGQNQPGRMQGFIILDTDYDNYAIEYICMSFYKMIRLLARTPEAPSESLYKLFTSLLSSSELNNYNVNSYPQLNCK